MINKYIYAYNKSLPNYSSELGLQGLNLLRLPFEALHDVCVHRKELELLEELLYLCLFLWSLGPVFQVGHHKLVLLLVLVNHQLKLFLHRLKQLIQTAYLVHPHLLLNLEVCL